MYGAELENIETLAALREQGCEVLCLVRHERWNDHVPAALAARGLAWRKIPYIDGWLPGWRIRIMLRNPIAFIVGNWRFYRIVREFRPTHIHSFNPLHIASFIAALVPIGVPMIYRAGEKPVIHRWIWRLLWRFVVARTCCFISVSNFIADELKATGVKAEKIEVIHGIPPKRRLKEALPVIKPFDGCTRNIAFVGQISESKGLHLLVRAFRCIAESNAQVRLLIAGRISEWSGDKWARELRDSVKQDPILRSCIVFLGYVEDVPNLLRDSELLVAPSLVEEGFPLVVMEAKAAGIPSIVFPSGGLSEMIEHGVDGFICHDKSTGALIEAIRLYINDPTVAMQQGAAAKASLDRLGVAKFANDWLAVYEKTGRPSPNDDRP
jgi:glycosyltransferase involved in cell wall biosynthesis